MERRRRTDQPDALGDGRPFGWRPFILASVLAGVGCSLSAVALDTVLIRYGVPLTPFWDAFFSGFFGIVFGMPGFLLVWRLGVVTLQQYILCSLILLSPLTILSLFFVSITQDVVLQAPWDSEVTISAHDLAYTGYVRILRSLFLVPIFLFIFTLMYHRYYGCGPKR